MADDINPNLPSAAHRVRLEGIDLKTTFPSLHLFESFRMALQPTKLLLALLMLILIYFAGVALDFVWGPQTTDFGPSYHVFQQFVTAELRGFDQLVSSAARLDLGVDALVAARVDGGGMAGGLDMMLLGAPGWLWSAHPWFFVLFFTVAGLVTMLLGGAIARLAAEQACLGRTVGVAEAVRFTLPRAAWYLITPLIPLVVAGALWLILAIAGWALFNLPGLNVLGGLLYGVMLLAGLVMAMLLIFLLLGAWMMPAALSVEGTDAFDAVSRVSAFILYRPMRYLLLLIVTLLYGALTYALVGLVVLLTLHVTRHATGVWVGSFDQLMPLPQFGQPLGALEPEALSGTAEATAWLVRIWCALLFGMSLAYAISYFFTAQTWMYLLLRQSADGSAFVECAVDAKPVAAVAEKIEPAPPALRDEPADGVDGHGPA